MSVTTPHLSSDLLLLLPSPEQPSDLSELPWNSARSVGQTCKWPNKPLRPVTPSVRIPGAPTQASLCTMLDDPAEGLALRLRGQQRDVVVPG